MKASPEKILVKSPNWLGDNVFVIPAVRKLRKMYPQARLSVLVQADLGPLWEIMAAVDEVILYNLPGGLKCLKEKWGLLKSLRGKGFDLAVIFPRSFEAALWMKLAGIPGRWGYRAEGRSLLLTRPTRSPRGYRHTHRIDYYYHLLDNARSDAPAPPARLNLPEEELASARLFLQKETGRKDFDFLVGLHPRASHGPAKCWPLENYAELAKLLVHQKNASVLVFGKENEREIVEDVVRAGSPRAFNLAGKTDLKQLSALIRICHIFVGNDTGPLHLAAALGVPVVGLFGSSDPQATAPRGSHTRVIYKNVPCSPCLKRSCPTDFSCMTSITPQEVLFYVDELREQRPAVPASDFISRKQKKRSR